VTAIRERPRVEVRVITPPAPPRQPFVPRQVVRLRTDWRRLGAVLGWASLALVVASLVGVVLAFVV